MMAENGKNHTVNLNKEFFNNLKFDTYNLKQYRINSAVKCAETLGNKPALCLSGGIDSQSMVQCWLESGLKFDVVIGVFKNDLNKHDVDHARLFCQTYNIPYKELSIDIIQLLTRENYALSEKYKSYSPHFNVHYKIVEILAEQGYTGVCFGGVTPFKRNSGYGDNFFGTPFHFLKIQNILPIPMQGSFLSFFPELTWAIALLGSGIKADGNVFSSKFFTQDSINHLNELRYKEKIESYQKVGFSIIPQEKKFTGFELVKKYFEELTGDGWSFEKRFRYPIANTFASDKNSYSFDISFDVLATINSIHMNNI